MAQSKNPAGGGTPAGAGSLDTEISGSSPNNTKSNVGGATAANALPPMAVRRATDGRWLVTIEGVGDLEVTEARLRSFKKFHRACMEKLNR